jgi:hypothetical protein
MNWPDPCEFVNIKVLSQYKEIYEKFIISFHLRAKYEKNNSVAYLFR